MFIKTVLIIGFFLSLVSASFVASVKTSKVKTNSANSILTLQTPPPASSTTIDPQSNSGARPTPTATLTITKATPTPPRAPSSFINNEDKDLEEIEMWFGDDGQLDDLPDFDFSFD